VCVCVCVCAVRETDIQAILEDKLSEALCTATHPVADTADDEWTFIRDSTYRARATERGVQAVHCTGAHDQKRGPNTNFHSFDFEVLLTDAVI